MDISKKAKNLKLWAEITELSVALKRAALERENPGRDRRGLWLEWITKRALDKPYP